MTTSRDDSVQDAADHERHPSALGDLLQRRGPVYTVKEPERHKECEGEPEWLALHKLDLEAHQHGGGEHYCGDGEPTKKQGVSLCLLASCTGKPDSRRTRKH